MRILLFCMSVNFGGAERHAVELANALADEHEVAILILKRPPDPRQQPRYDALVGAVSPRVRLFVAAKKMPLLGLLRALAQFRPDIVHTHLERAARWAKRVPFGPPVIATIHCEHFREYDACDAVICLTPAQAAHLPRARRGAVFQIGNWVLPHPPVGRAAARAALGLGDDDFIVGAVGRIDPIKQFPALIEAFMAADLPGTKLVVVGTGAGDAPLAAQAASCNGRVVLAGFRRDVRDLYAAFDLFVLNSSEEPFGLVLLEALDAGVPVVATATDGARAIAEQALLHLVPVGDEAAMVAALRAGRARLLAASPGGAEAFRIGAVLPRFVQAYREVVGRRRRSVSYASAIPRTTQT